MHSFNFIALSAFIKTHFSQREREKTRRREKKVPGRGVWRGETHRWRVRGERTKGGIYRDINRKEEISRQRRVSFPKMLDQRNCCFKAGQVLWVVLFFLLLFFCCFFCWSVCFVFVRLYVSRAGVAITLGTGSCGRKAGVARRSRRVWGAQQEWLMMNLGCSGPMGLPIHVSIPILLIHPPPPTQSPSPRHPTFVPICNCRGRGHQGPSDVPPHFLEDKNEKYVQKCVTPQSSSLD